MRLARWNKAQLMLLAGALWVGVGLVAPLILSRSTSDHIGDAVEASTADTFVISQPIILSSTPLIRIDRGTGMFVDSAGKPLPPGTAPPANNGNLRLFNAAITISGVASAGQADVDLTPLATALQGASYDTLNLRRATLFVAMPGDTHEVITDVTADVSLKRRGHVAIKGEGRIRGQSVSLDAHASPALTEKRATSGQSLTPLKFALKGEHIDATFDGRLVVAGTTVGIEGPSEISLASARRVARWLGASWATGSGLRNMSIRGKMEATSETIAFQKAVVRMDGNEAAGVLAMRFGSARPVVSGTLAYKTLDITPYISQEPAGGLMERLSWSRLSSNALTVPLGRHLDIDLRISADKVTAGKVDIGPTATTIALKDGRMLADIGGLAVGGSEGGGQVVADFNGTVPRVTIRGKLDNVDLAQLSQMVGGTSLLNGKASIVADLIGTGSTPKDLAEALGGKISIRSQSPVRLGLDLRALNAAAQQQEFSGWPSQGAARATTLHDALELRLVLRDGTLLTDTAELRSAEGTWVASGVVNVLADRMDMRLSRISPPAGSQGGPQTGPQAGAAIGRVAEPTGLEIKGTLQEPRIKSEASR